MKIISRSIIILSILIGLIGIVFLYLSIWNDVNGEKLFATSIMSFLVSICTFLIGGLFEMSEECK